MKNKINCLKGWKKSSRGSGNFPEVVSRHRKRRRNRIAETDGRRNEEHSRHDERFDQFETKSRPNFFKPKSSKVIFDRLISHDAFAIHRWNYNILLRFRYSEQV